MHADLRGGVRADCEYLLLWRQRCEGPLTITPRRSSSARTTLRAPVSHIRQGGVGGRNGYWYTLVLAWWHGK